MDLPVGKANYLRIDYPAVVENEDRMLETLGGEKCLSKPLGMLRQSNVAIRVPMDVKTLNHSSKRFELHFRPQDPYCKPACGDRHDTAGVLLRVRRRRRRRRLPKHADNSILGVSCASEDQAHQGAGSSPACSASSAVNPSSSQSQDCPSRTHQDVIQDGEPSDFPGLQDSPDYEYQAEIVGSVSTMVKFQTLADFQYLPMERAEEGGAYTSLVDDLVLQKLESRQCLKQKVPLFLPPGAFSRIDSTQEYCFRDAPKHRPPYQDPTQSLESGFIGVARQRRPHYTRFFNFNDKEVPTEPYPEALKKIHKKVKDPLFLEKLKELFEERPVWSRNAVMSRVAMPSCENLKYILPGVAFYHMVGPWGRLWNKLGYDPRKDPISKHWQALDFRFRSKAPHDDQAIAAKRSTMNYLLPNTVSRSQMQAALIRKETLEDWKGKPEERLNAKIRDARHKKEAMYKFHPNILPAYRQMFYQFCDIEEPEVQRLVHVNDGMETGCTEKDGWCLPDTDEKVRAIMTEHMNKLVAGTQHVTPRSSTAPELSTNPKGKRGPKHLPKSSSAAKSVPATAPTGSGEEWAFLEDTQKLIPSKTLGGDDEADSETEAGPLMEDEEYEEEDGDYNEMEMEELEYMDPNG